MTVVSGRQIVSALKGRWNPGSWGTCCCPAHDDRSPSLSVKQTRDIVLVKCHAGCPQDRVIDALRARGLWSERESSGHLAPRAAPFSPQRSIGKDADEISNTLAAKAIWKSGLPISERSAARLYLWSRCVNIGHLPPTLRAVPDLYCSETRRSLPAMIAAIQDSHNHITAIQQIWVLDKYLVDGGNGSPKGSRAPLKTAKKTLGPMGDGAVRLARPGATLGIAEGIETALSAQQLYSLPVWAALGAARLGRIGLPDCVKRVIVFADAGPAGEQAADRARDTYENQGLAVEIIYPPEPAEDFNAYLRARTLGDERPGGRR